MDSNPTPRALVVDSYDGFISSTKDKVIVKDLQESSNIQSHNSLSNKRTEKLKNSIDLICKYQKPFIKKSLDKLLENSVENAEILCNYIIVEQNEINIKESTKEGKIKVILDLIRFLNFKDLRMVTKEDILAYLNRYRKPEEIDSDHRWIGTWNNRHLILLKFFRWLHDPYNPEIKNRKTPNCMNGVKRLKRREVSRYKPADLWTQGECDVFLILSIKKRQSFFFRWL